MSINDTISEDDNKNRKSNSFKGIEIVGYSSAAVVEMLRALDLDIFTPYALKDLFLIETPLGLLSRDLTGTVNTKLYEAIQDCNNQVLDEYDDESTQDI